MAALAAAAGAPGLPLCRGSRGGRRCHGVAHGHRPELCGRPPLHSAAEWGSAAQAQGAAVAGQAAGPGGADARRMGGQTAAPCCRLKGGDSGWGRGVTRRGDALGPILAHLPASTTVQQMRGGPTCTRAVGEGLGKYHDVLGVQGGEGSDSA